jgi:undecaprenyl phosphate-alpha-L-ara4N flippase subunit ArnF
MSQNYFSNGWFFVSVSVLLSSCAQLFMRVGMLTLNESNIPLALASIIENFDMIIPMLVWVFAGLVSYCISLLFWMRALAQYELSLAYPLLSMSYALVYIGAANWPRLNETISVSRSAGIALIFIGVLIVARTDKNTAQSQ